MESNSKAKEGEEKEEKKFPEPADVGIEMENGYEESISGQAATQRCV